jgi:hypothetical protein
MVAAVDRRTQRTVVVGAAAAARLGGRFVQHDLRAAALQLNGGRETGKARANHMNEPCHQKKA